MRDWLRRLLSIFVTVAFLGGTIGVDYAFGADPCDDDLTATDSADHAGHHHGHDANKLGCPSCPCCAVVTTLPVVPGSLGAPRQLAYIVYVERSPHLTGRSIPPDLSPPRPSA